MKEIKHAYNAETFWKNFRLGSELQIAGTFIYNSLFSFENMEHFHYEHECFEFLYNASVGLERLEKITLILLEYSKDFDQADYERTIITHSHIELIGRIKKCKDVNLGKIHYKFLHLLTNFYKSSRYDRFNISSVFHPNQDQKILVEFIEENLSVTVTYDSFFPTANDKKIKQFIGKIILTIANTLYDIIRERAYELNVYTYEVVSFSKAYKIFMERDYSFEKEKQLQKEILINLINYKNKTPFYNFIETIEPLDFDIYEPNQYIKFLLNIQKNRDILDELHHLNEEADFNIDRLAAIDAIGSDVIFDETTDEFE